MYFRDSDWENGCGPGLLARLFGGTSRFWLDKIIARRKKIKNWEKRHPDEVIGDDWTWTHEITSIISKQIKKKLREIHPRKKVSFISFVKRLPKKGTFLIILEEHYLVVHDGLIYDNCDNGTLPKNFRHRKDKVESWVKLPRLWKPEPKPEPEKLPEINFNPEEMYPLSREEAFDHRYYWDYLVSYFNTE